MAARRQGVEECGGEVVLRDNKEYVEDKLEVWQMSLGLSDWDIRYDPKRGSGRDAHARMDLNSYRRMGQLRLAKDMPDEHVPYFIVHELLHIWLIGLRDPIVNTYGCDAWHPVAAHEEALINALAAALTGDRWRAHGKELKHYSAFAA